MAHPVLPDQLPEPLPAAQIIALNRPGPDLHTTRCYEWNGWTFTVPPGVFRPGATSRMVHERLLDGTIDVEGRVYVAMGVGLGVEAVVAGRRGAAEVHACDVDPASVRAAQQCFDELAAPTSSSTFVPVVSDLFEEFPPGFRADVITFNPPAVSQRVSDDPAVVRNVCTGSPLVARFFTQIAERRLLAPGGEVFLIVSNTADLRAIIGHATGLGFATEIAHLHDWQDGVLTYLFRLTEEDR
ncbi:methyltransferase [Saccharopolyspora hordei]|uniref:Release factor glutamine methyltransferase n=1 Tax=Saccharopolyspora hordei TaxID=1838 RepID=A0A853ANX2_9PSEU|nr:release factor glutamine methyltransferase [Saccharopolyspora hordei]